MSFQRTLFYTYNPGTTTTYGIFKDAVNIRGFVTTGNLSSTTTTATETSGDGAIPFAPVGVGDLIYVKSKLEVPTYRLVTTKTSNTSIVVNTAWTIPTAGQSAKFQPWISGTASTSGWFPTTTFKTKTVKLNIDTIGSTAITVSIEGKMSEEDATGYVIFTKAYTATGSDVFTITEPWSYMRVGFKDAGDAGADSVSAWFVCSDIVAL